MDITKLPGVFSPNGNVQVEAFSPEQTKTSLLDVTDVVTLSAKDKDKSREELIEETLLLSLIDRMDKLEGAVERLEKMGGTPHPVAPSPVSQIAADDTGKNPDGLASSNAFTPVTLIETPEDSPAKSPQAQADFITSKYFSAASFFDPSIGKNLDVVVGEAPQGGSGAAAGAAGVGAAAGIAAGAGAGLGSIKG